MLLNAKENIVHIEGIDFMEIDAQCIPYPTYTFHCIIANHMLYHVQDIDKVLHEVSRTLKPSGAFYATTGGMDNLRELREIVEAFDDKIKYPTNDKILSFRLDNGEKILKKHFSNVKKLEYEDGLRVTDAKILLNYIISLGSITNAPKILVGDRTNEFIEYINSIIKKKGSIEITKQAGMFICDNNI